MLWVSTESFDTPTGLKRLDLEIAVTANGVSISSFDMVDSPLKVDLQEKLNNIQLIATRAILHTNNSIGATSMADLKSDFLVVLESIVKEASTRE